jgi:DNA-binding LacI/PurR family transcriptional regulator
MADTGKATRRDQIHASLRDRILAGHWRAGEFLPSEAELGRRFRASRVTVRAALKCLRQEGLAQTQPGVGWRVGGARTPEPPVAQTPICFLPESRPPTGEVLQGLRRYLGEVGLEATVQVAPFEGAHGPTPLRELVDLDTAQGLVFSSATPLPSPYVSALRATRKPFVCAGLAAHEPYDTICTDNVRGLELLVEALVARGHRHIAFASSDDVSCADPSFGSRQLGYEQAMLRRGLTPAVIRTRYNYFLGPEEERLILAWLKGLESQGRRPTCLIGACDAMACQLLTLLTRNGLRVPADISVAGFDRDRSQEVVVARFGLTALTTIEQPWEEIGRTAASRLVARMRGEPANPALTLIQPRLQEGDSVSTVH